MHQSSSARQSNTILELKYDYLQAVFARQFERVQSPDYPDEQLGGVSVAFSMFEKKSSASVMFKLRTCLNYVPTMETFFENVVVYGTSYGLIHIVTHHV